MFLDLLTAISPIDGRYRNKTSKLADYFSEYALIRYRIRVEIEYFIALCELPLPQLASFDKSLFERIRDIIWCNESTIGIKYNKAVITYAFDHP